MDDKLFTPDCPIKKKNKQVPFSYTEVVYFVAQPGGMSGPEIIARERETNHPEGKIPCESLSFITAVGRILHDFISPDKT